MRIELVAVAFCLLLAGCSHPEETLRSVSPTDPAATACVHVAAALKLASQSASGSFTASELVPKLTETRDRLFNDARVLGPPTTEKESFFDKTTGVGDVLYQLGLRAGGLGNALDTNATAESWRSGIGAFGELANSDLHC